MKHYLALMFMLLLGLAPAFAGDGSPGYAAAEETFVSGRFAEARRMLQDPALRADPDALMLLANMTRDGRGGPSDPVEAYKLFSLVFMIGDPDPRADALALRRGVARDLSWEQILEGEKRVVDWVDEGLGPQGRAALVDRLGAELDACNPMEDSCTAIAEQVYALGPAAAGLVGPLARLMTRDPKWMPREDYAAALAMIGTAAVPALCRILLDEEELATEGSWNTSQAAFFLGHLGPTAARARRCMVKALARDYEKLGLGDSEIMTFEEGSLRDMIYGLNNQLLFSLVRITDPEREIYGSLQFFLMQESDLRTKLLTAWAIEVLYDEYDRTIALLPAGLDSPDGETRWIALSVLLDSAEAPGFATWAAPLAPRLRALALDGDEDVADLAMKALYDLPPRREP